MKRPAMEYRHKSDEYDGPEDEATHLIHDVLYVPDHHVRLTVVLCSFSMRQRILQSRFRPVYLALADQWEEMDREMEGFKSHDAYELVPRTNGCAPSIKLVWVLHRKSKKRLFERNKGKLVARGNHQHPSID